MNGKRAFLNLKSKCFKGYRLLLFLNFLDFWFWNFFFGFLVLEFFGLEGVIFFLVFWFFSFLV